MSTMKTSKRLFKKKGMRERWRDENVWARKNYCTR